MSARTQERATIFHAALYGTVAAGLFNVEPVFVDAVRHDLGFSEEQVGRLVACELAGIGLMSVLSAFGPAAFRRGYSAVVALIVCIVGNLLSLGVDDWLALSGLRFLIGVFGEGRLYALCAALAGRAENPPRAFAWVTLVQVSFAVLGLSLLPRAASSWGMAAVLLPLSVAAVLALPWASRDRSWQATQLLTRHRLGSQDFRALACAAAIVIWHSGIGAYWVFSSDFGRAIGIDPIHTGDALAIGMACGLAGALAPVLLPSYWSHARLFGLGMTIQLAAIIAIHFATSWATYAGAVIAWNCSWNFALPYILGLFALMDRDNRLIRLSPAAQGLGLALGPAIGGTLVADRGLVAVLGFYAITIVVAFGIYCWVDAAGHASVREADHV